MRVAAILVGLAVLTGCQLGFYRSLDNPGTDQIVRVQSGDRFVFELPNTTGLYWAASSDDSDVTVQVYPSGVKTDVEIRVHRGYDGPSLLTFRLLEEETHTEVRRFTLSFFRRTGDAAFWK